MCEKYEMKQCDTNDSKGFYASVSYTLKVKTDFA